MTSPVYVDGRPVAAVSALDRGLQFGDGLFETCAIVRGTMPLRERHFARLRRGLEWLAIDFREWDALASECASVARSAGTGVLKIIVTRGSSARGYAPPAYARPRRIVYLAPLPQFPPELRLIVCATRLASGGSLAGLKHLNRLEQVLGRREVDGAPDADDGLMLDAEKRVIETTSSNLFLVHEGALTTPAVTRCGVAGVMRELILERCAALGLSCEVRDVSLDEVATADELFVTGSLFGVRPVVAVGREQFARGPITAQVATAAATAFGADP